MDRRTDKAPIFFYAQPQNIHLATLADLPLNYRPRREYTGFKANYASELERLDGCFGDFIGYLKRRGLYENSIIVLTADHGEEMDEEPHANHAFSLRPEVLRVPLIIHLPAEFRNYFYDQEAVAFLTDITPSIYYLLGHRQIQRSEFFGRPLFTLTREEHLQYLRPTYLVESSYGPLYGILTRQPIQIYIDDATNYRRRFFDLSKDPRATHNFADETIEHRYQAIIHKDIDGLTDFYGFKPEPVSFLKWLTR
jgi:arylsulfatase A-like enzyme